VSDVQAGHEKTLTGLLPALAGANIIYGLGMLEMGVTFSAAQLMIDADIAEMILYVVNGVKVSDETLSVDVTKEVGYRKDFLTHRHTFKNRHIQSDPALIDRQMRNRWEEAGCTDMSARAGALAKKLIAEYRPAPLAEEAGRAIRAIVNDREKELGLALSAD
jgi:trimethylamine--corrinoid protein Co-methyltransferase